MKNIKFKTTIATFIFGIFILFLTSSSSGEIVGSSYSGSANTYGTYTNYNYNNYNYPSGYNTGTSGYGYNNYGYSGNGYSGYSGYSGSSGSSGYSGSSSNSYSGSSNYGTYSGSSGTYSGTTGSSTTFGGTNVQYTDPTYGGSYGYVNPSQYWSDYGKDTCFARQDIIMQIMPFGCSPEVVRSDLLEEQNVPVFCKVMSIQANPLIDISKVKSIHFNGQYPKGVSGISYFPSRVALAGNNNGMRNIESSPVNTEMGYLVIVLTRQENENNMSDYVSGNISASVSYDSEGAYGIGKNTFYLSELHDQEWASDYKQYGLWNGKAYIRADSITPEGATISIYRDSDTKVNTVTLRRGETSRDLYLPGFYCAAGLNVRLDSITAPVDSALLQINDQQIWVARGDRIIDDKCTVSGLQTSAGGGKVTLNCPGKDGKIELSLTPGKAILSSSSFGDVNFAVGEKISTEENVYLAYLGLDSNGKRFGVVVKDLFSDTAAEFSEKGVYDVIDKVALNSNKNVYDLKSIIQSAVEGQYKKKLSNVPSEELKSKVEVYLVSEGEEAFGLRLTDVSVGVDNRVVTKDSSTNDVVALNYYNKAINKYEELSELYPGEKRIEGEDSYAAMGLYEAGKLSKTFDMNAKAQEFYNKLITNYPDSAVSRIVSVERDGLTRYDTTKSKSSIMINNNQYVIDLLGFKKPSTLDRSAVLLVDGQEDTLSLNEIRTLKRSNETFSIQLTELSDQYVLLKLDRISGKQKGSTSRVQRLGYGGDQTNFEGINIKLEKINLQEQAKIVVIPKTFGTNAQSNFTFKIGIEKRAIKLSTDQTKELMDNLIKSLEQWKDLNAKLGNVIKVMKGACFATSAILTAKTYLDGLNGASIARNTIMTSKNGWNEVCEKLVSEKKYSTLQQCLLDKNSEIESDVKIYSNQIEKTNNILKGIQDSVGVTHTDPLDISGQVDSKKVESEFKKKFDDFCKNAQGGVSLPDKEKTYVSFGGENGICSMENMTQEQRRVIFTLYNVKNSGGSSVLTDVSEQEMGKTVLEAKNYADLNRARNIADQTANKLNLNLDTLTPAGDSITYGDIKRITRSDSSNPAYGNFKEGNNVVRVFIPPKKSIGNSYFEANPEVAGKEVIVEVKEVSGAKGTYIIGDKIYTVDGKEISANASISVKNYMSLSGMNRIKQTDNKAYHNQILNSNQLMVKYFDRAPYKGLPAEVPFDVNEGWYVELTYVLSGFGKPYDESGKPVNFYICNVGDNGLIEFKQAADDICRYYNGETGADLNFPGMNVGESKTLINKATSAITEAAKQYGKDRVTVNGHSFKSGTSFGGEEGKCSDFMSPMDCNILFNVCDPVICPASRCDLGGEYRVDNVIQSGVIGSLTLCLPNMREGIAVPICLTGVNAGLENYISILNSTVQCLNESLTTGKNVGICDEIKSIYLCDFFWKQAGPFLNILLPNLVQGLYGQGARGGGEYLTVKQSWENMQNAIGYFRDEYAVNSMQAFNARSVDEVGTDICKSFVSTSGFSSLFSSLIEPDSPVQFSAWFSEDQLTTATVPATSHYKVYYHIYAGKDMGSYYSIYLKNPTTVTSVNSIGYYTVATGYIAKGSQVDEAKDFTGPSGFKQLCVNINGKDECGFGSVSTSYVLNSLSDSYVEEQIRTDIKSEKECVSGTPSLYSLINPNLQSGVEDALEGQLYNEGIIRVCASQNPGKKVLSSGEYDTTNSTYDRWKDVGYCDDTTIRCWLDTNSVKNVVNNKAILNETLKNVDLAQLGANEYWTPDESMSIATKARNGINELSISSSDSENTIISKIGAIEQDLNLLTRLGANNLYRARGLYLLANLYRKVAENKLVIVISETPYGDTAVPGETDTSVDSSSSTTSTDSTNTGIDTTSDSEGSVPPGDAQVDTGSTGITDDSLREGVAITVNYATTKKFYSYTSGKGWVSDDSTFVSDVNSQRLGYVSGLRYIIKKTNFLGTIVIENFVIDNGLFQSDSDLENEVFNALKK